MGQQIMQVVRPALDVLDASKKALDWGAQTHSHPLYPERAGTYVTWDIAARCEKPVMLQQLGRGGFVAAHELRIKHDPNTGEVIDRSQPVYLASRQLDMLTPCRRCRACLKARARMWGKRAVAMWKQGERTQCRTWFGTLTFNAEERSRAVAKVDVDLDMLGTRFSRLEPFDQFRALHGIHGEAVTKYWKRLRKGNKGAKIPPLRFKYFCAVEPHEDMTPHYHVLVHELDPAEPIRQKVLEAVWPLGRMQYRLVKDERQAFYAAKYLGKWAVARVQASAHYGTTGECASQSPSHAVTTSVVVATQRENIDPPKTHFLSASAEGEPKLGEGDCSNV
jgi:hypothetical protein